MTSNNWEVSFDCQFKIDVNNWQKEAAFHLFDGKVDLLYIQKLISEKYSALYALEAIMNFFHPKQQ